MSVNILSLYHVSCPKFIYRISSVFNSHFFKIGSATITSKFDVNWMEPTPSGVRPIIVAVFTGYQWRVYVVEKFLHHCLVSTLHLCSCSVHLKISSNFPIMHKPSGVDDQHENLLCSLLQVIKG